MVWLVTRVESSGVIEPYDVVRPYSTREVAASFVVQVMVAALPEMPVAVTAEMVGAVVSRTMVSVNAADQLPAASRNCT